MGASLLTAVNLPELITNSQEDYELLAIELATNPTKYENIKGKLSNNLKSSPLFDTKQFAKHLESAYLEIYSKYHRGDKLEHLYVD